MTEQLRWVPIDELHPDDQKSVATALDNVVIALARMTLEKPGFTEEHYAMARKLLADAEARKARRLN